jgi:hypothetical protein
MGDILHMASVRTTSLTIDLALLLMMGAITRSNIALLTPMPKMGVTTTNPTVVHTLLPRSGVTLASPLVALTLLPRTSVVSFSDPRPRVQQLTCTIVQQLEAQLRTLSAVIEDLSRVQIAQPAIQPTRPQTPQGATHAQAEVHTGAFVPPTGGIEDLCNDLESETPIPPNPASRWANFPQSIAADDREIAARNASRVAAFAATGQPPFLAREHYRSLSADGWRSTGTFAPIGSTHTGPDPRGPEYEGLPDYGAQPQEPHW